MSGFRQTYTHKKYHSRGAERNRDFVYEGIIAKTCLYCGKKLERKLCKSGIESMRNFLRRKTCGKICQFRYFVGKNAGNYKGYMDICICKDCGKRVGYPTIEQRKSGMVKRIERCRKCWYKYNKKFYWGSEKNKKISSENAKKLWADGKLKASKKLTTYWIGKKRGKMSDKQKDRISKSRIKKIKDGTLVVSGRPSKGTYKINCLVCKKLLEIPLWRKDVKFCGLKCVGKAHSKKIK
jgi:hypothetical protein